MSAATATMLPVYRITVFVPPEAVQGLLDGICAVDDLRIGDYDRVLWTSAPGIEQFRPLPGATPTQGDVGAVERGATVRVEFCIPRDDDRLARVIALGIRPHHPWQVPAIFVDASVFPLP
ncbi:hypothetical protein [Chiayiivirga flava]|uniref:Uncharacterized protein n=1 Tax=Chiayiivirga flava TaxID=659595 RepID=A0A7W8D3H8_9GAMM|nr:hypothetical protein [Chiayiivirga flava]